VNLHTLLLSDRDVVWQLNNSLFALCRLHLPGTRSRPSYLERVNKLRPAGASIISSCSGMMATVPATRVLKIIQVNKGLLFPSFITTTERDSYEICFGGNRGIFSRHFLWAGV
jgi:hypothetical protein